MGYAEDFISEGLKAGHSIDDLIANMNQSDDEEEKAFASRWLSTASKPEYAPGATERKTISGSITPMLNVINENPEAAAAVAGAAVAGTAARRYMKGREQSQMAREKHQMDLRRLSLEEQRAADYARQVAAQEKSLITPDIQKQAAALSPAAQEAAPKPSVTPGQQPGFTGNAQPTAMPAQQPYGATTINAPTGVPGPAVPPSGAAPQPVAPAPADPIQAARIRKAEAEAAIAEHKLQQLQAGPKTVASGKAATPGYSEAEMKMVQQGGAASASKALEAQKIAGSVAPKPDPIAATATPAEKASAVAVVEETPKTSSGMREQYHKSKKNPIGPGGFNWLSGQEGPNAQQLWEEVYGKKNVPYEQVVSDYSKAKVGPQIPRESGKPGGSFEKPKMIPEYIKGSASPAALAATAALATIPALASAGYQSYKGNKEAVDAELKDAWSSLKSAFNWPVDVAKAAGKGDFGPLKDTLMSMNPATLMLNEVSKHDEQALKRMVQAEKVGAGRGIAPPSAYQR